MAIMASRGGTYTPAPEGSHDAVFCDVVDLGMVDGTYGKKQLVQVVWQLAVKMEDGRPFTVSRRYGLSLHEKAALYKDLKSYGKKAPPANLDLETLIGKPCTVLVVHAERDGSTFANVQALLPAGAKKLTVDKDFLRKKDRSATGANPTVIGTDDGDGNTVPF